MFRLDCLSLTSYLCKGVVDDVFFEALELNKQAPQSDTVKSED